MIKTHSKHSTGEPTLQAGPLLIEEPPISILANDLVDGEGVCETGVGVWGENKIRADGTPNSAQLYRRALPVTSVCYLAQTRERVR